MCSRARTVADEHRIEWARPHAQPSRPLRDRSFARLDDMPNRDHRRRSRPPSQHVEHRLRRPRSASTFPRARPGRHRLLNRLGLRKRLQRTLARASRDGLRTGRNFEHAPVQLRSHNDARRHRRSGSPYPPTSATTCDAKNRAEIRSSAAPFGTPNRVEFGFADFNPKSGLCGLVAPATSLQFLTSKPRVGLAQATIFAPDGADVLDYVTEIPLPGRMLVRLARRSRDTVPPQSPCRRSSPARKIASSPERSRNYSKRATLTADAAKPFTPDAARRCSAPAAPAKRIWPRPRSPLANPTRRGRAPRTPPPPTFATASTTPSNARPTSISARIPRPPTARHRRPAPASRATITPSQELRYTLDAYEEHGSTVVVTSLRPANTLANMPARYPQPPRRRPVAATRTARRRRSRANHLATPAPSAGSARSPNDAADELASTASTAPPTTCSAQFSSSGPRQRRTTAQAPTICSPPARPPAHDLREIIAVVARHQNVPQKQLKSSSRRQSIVFARAIAIYLARELAGASYEQIGRALGGRDHTTIIHNYRKIDTSERNPQTAAIARRRFAALLLSR